MRRRANRSWNKIRSHRPEVLEHPAPRGEAGSRRPTNVLALNENVLGVLYSDFAALPAEVWNHVVGSVRSFLSDVMRRLDTAYRLGADTQLRELLNRTIPENVYALGREMMQSLCQVQRGFVGSTIACHECTGSLKFEGDKPRQIKSRLGTLHVSRSYYHGGCGHSCFPLDGALGLDRHGILPELQEIVALQASRVPYDEAVRTLTELLPIELSQQTAQAVTATVAAEIRANQEKERKTAFSKARNSQFPEPDNAKTPAVAVVAADGGMCRTRDKQETYKEIKLGVLGRLEPTPGTEFTAHVEDKRYVAHFTTPDSFFERLQIEYHRAGLHRAPILVVLGDGAPWMWLRFNQLPAPDQEFIEILDFFHASEHVRDLSIEIYGAESPKGKAWYDKLRGQLLDGELRAFFRALRQKLKSATSKRLETVDSITREISYFTERRHLLRYREMRERGLPIGSGMVEGGVRYVAKDRLDRTGMRWNTAGAENILQLRCLDAGGRWTSECARRESERAERYERSRTAWLRAA